MRKNAPLDLKNKGLEQRQLNDLSEEEENLLKKSREALIAKARVYDRLLEGEIGEEEAEFVERYLVRFERKKSRLPDLPPDYREDDVDRYRDSEEDGEIGPPYEPAKNRDEEWVEYVDCLGRTRTCLRKDLDYLKSKDKDLELIVEEKRRNREKSPTPPKPPTPPPPTEDSELLSHDMRRELLRQQWEKEEEELRKKSDIHYQDILFDEARTHGVGYYGFSKHEETRKKQQDALNKLRQETKQEQKKSKDLKEMREKQLAARVRAAENRKRARMGLPPLTDEPAPPPAPEKPEVKEIDPEKQALENMLEELRKKHVRPWDKGKARKEHYEYSQEEWVAKKRRERKEEFAPPRQFNAAPKVFKDVSSDEERNSRKPLPKRREFHARPIQNELSSSDTEADEEERRGRKTEIAPPVNYETETKRVRTNNETGSVSDSIEAGLKFLREQLEKKESRRRDEDMFLS